MTKKGMRVSTLSLFYIALVLHGLQRMVPLFIIEFSKNKNITRQDAAIPFIYSWAVTKIVGSFSGFLINDKSSNLVIFCGVSLCTIGAALCILDADITEITLFWGFIFGSGHGLVSPYLTRDLSNENTSKSSFFMEIPSSFGISVMPFLLNILIFQYGLQGCFIIVSGIILQHIPFALAATYNIGITIPNIKWRVRKKNSQYCISKRDGEKTISIESFNNSLEPDLVLKLKKCDDYYRNIIIDNPVTFSKDKLRVGRKRSETRGNDLQSLEINRKKLQNLIKQCPTVNEKKKCKTNGKIFEDNLSSMHNTDFRPESQNLDGLKSGKIDNISAQDKSTFKYSKNDLDLINKTLKNTLQSEIKESECNVLYEQKILDHSFIQNTPSLIIDEQNEKIKRNISKCPETEKMFISKQAERQHFTSHNLHPIKLLAEKDSIMSPESLQSNLTAVFTIPLDIKVYVEEYTLTVNREDISNSVDINHQESKKNDEINYLQPKFQENEDVNNARQAFPRITPQNHKDKSNLSKLYSSSTKSILKVKTNSKANDKIILSNISKVGFKKNLIKILKFFKNIISPVCLSIVIITIIFETSLIVILTNISNFVNRASYDFKLILVAFGVGGFIGKLCCCKISKTISEKSHAVGIILFLLTGLSIAGVLYSPNMSWLAGFYSVLGALEGGISYILSKFILDYTPKEVHLTISSMKSFLSGVAIICLPSAIGLLPDEMKDYEFLLQTFSCLSVLCALLAYFLPYFRNISDRRQPKSYSQSIKL